MKIRLIKEWGRISQNYLVNIIFNMSTRLREVIRQKEQLTKYKKIIII